MKRITVLGILVGLSLLAAAGNLVAAATLTTLHTFTGVDGNAPEAGLALGTNGNFYGTTVNGGTGTNCIDGCGTLFEISSSGAFTSLYSFNEEDGEAPRSGLLQASDGNLYGTTFSGGPFFGLGNVFRITPTGVLTNLHTFRGNDGLGPEGTLIEGADGILYGTTAEGGVISLGTVFQIATNGVFASLNGNPSNGLNQPTAGLLLASDGNLYGTSEGGGSSTNCASGCGAIYRITTDGVVTNLHSFDKSDGQQPKSVLVEGTNGVLYGTTSGSPLGALNCANGCGTVFSITTNGVLTTLHTFTGPEGRLPYAGLVEGSDHNFYGTTFRGGGVFNAGTVFQITTNGVYTKLLSFTGANGGNPAAPLVQGSDGAFYGTTEVGGGTNGAGLGTVFKLTITTNSSATISCVLSPTLATNTVNTAHTVVATVISNGVAKSGLLVNFNVLGANVGHTGTATTSASGLGTFTYTGTTVGPDTIRAIAGTATGTATKVWIAAAATHDLAVTKLKAPKKITLTATKPTVTGKFAVTIQNNGDTTEIIPDLFSLANLVTLKIQSLDACTNPVAVLTTPKFGFPVNLASKKKLNLAYTAIFSCANDPLATSKTDAHNDYQTVTTVHYSVFGGADTVPANDNCPHDPFNLDKGCGGKKPDGTLGADVLTDVIIK